MIFISAIRSFIMTLFFPLTVIILAPLSILSNLLFHNRKIDDFFPWFWSKLVCKMYNVDIEVIGHENIPQGGALVLFNHSSFFDIYALIIAIHGVRFGAKAELFKIPLFGQALRAIGHLRIARDNRDDVFKIYAEAKTRFADGEKFCLAPEGGRFYSAEGLKNFKSGPFVFALSAEADLVPVIIVGAYQVWPKGSLFANWDRWHRTIQVHILKPVSTKGLSLEDRQDLQKDLYQQMNSVWVREGSQTEMIPKQ